MRIAVLVPTMGGGGAERQIQLLTEHLPAFGHDVCVITMRSLGHGSVERPVPTGTQRIRLDFTGRRLLTSPAKLRRSLRNWRADALLAFNEPAVLAARVTTVGSRLPLISSVRTSALPRGPRRLLMRISRRADATTVFNSSQSLQKYVAAGLSDPQRSQVIHNALADTVPATVRPRQTASPFRWIAVGRLTDAKGYDLLVESMSQLMQAGHLAILDIFGEGPGARALQRLIEDRQLGHAIHLRGFTFDWHSSLDDYDGFVLSSRWEGSPNAALEALACGMPMVASDVGNLAELLPEGRLAPPGDSAALAERMRALMGTDAARRTEEALASQRATCARHGLTPVMQRWNEALQRLLEENSRGTLR